MLTFLEGQALKKRDCPSKIGTVDNYDIDDLTTSNGHIILSLHMRFHKFLVVFFLCFF